MTKRKLKLEEEKQKELGKKQVKTLLDITLEGEVGFDWLWNLQATVIKANPQGSMNFMDTRISTSEPYKNIVEALKHAKSLKVHVLERFQNTTPLIAQIIAQAPYLEKLKISWDILHSGYSAIVGEYLAKSNTLRELDISKNKLGKEGVALVKALAKSPSLISLDISSNRIEASSQEICKYLAGLYTLETLNISNNNIVRFPLNVAQILAKSPSLKEINLSEGGMPDFYLEGMIGVIEYYKMSQAFRHSPTLRKVIMKLASDSDHGAGMIAQMFSKHIEVAKETVKEHNLAKQKLVADNIKDILSFSIPEVIIKLIGEYYGDYEGVLDLEV